MYPKVILQEQTETLFPAGRTVIVSPGVIDEHTSKLEFVEGAGDEQPMQPFLSQIVPEALYFLRHLIFSRRIRNTNSDSSALLIVNSAVPAEF
jgi:hypothetical protein